MPRLNWNVSEATRKRNPHLFPAVGFVESQQREQSQAAALERKPPRRQGRSRRARVIITLISIRRHELDGDNLIAGFKPMRDAIARKLGIDDADPRVVWEYGQVVTRGEVGTIVKLETL